MKRMLIEVREAEGVKGDIGSAVGGEGSSIGGAKGVQKERRFHGLDIRDELTNGDAALKLLLP